jgi:hypothetical protein
MGGGGGDGRAGARSIKAAAPLAVALVASGRRWLGDQGDQAQRQQQRCRASAEACHGRLRNGAKVSTSPSSSELAAQSGSLRLPHLPAIDM